MRCSLLELATETESSVSSVSAIEVSLDDIIPNPYLGERVVPKLKKEGSLPQHRFVYRSSNYMYR